jgi:hypothetical protein
MKSDSEYLVFFAPILYEKIKDMINIMKNQEDNADSKNILT